MILQGCPHPPVSPSTVLPWPNKHMRRAQAFWVASVAAYQSWLLSVERAALRNARKVYLPCTRFHVGPHEFAWGALVHGAGQKRAHENGYMPFEAVRKTCQLHGEYVVLTYGKGSHHKPAVLRFTMQEIMGSCRHKFTIHKIVPKWGPYAGRECHVFVYGEAIEWHTLNIVPF